MNCEQWLNCILAQTSTCPYCKETPCRMEIARAIRNGVEEE